MQRLKNFKVLERNKYELYVSFLVVFVGFLQMVNRPQSYKDVLVASCALLIGLFCACNALLDLERMNWFERILAVPWFTLLLLSAPFFIWEAANIGTFSNR